MLEERQRWDGIWDDSLGDLAPSRPMWKGKGFKVVTSYQLVLCRAFHCPAPKAVNSSPLGGSTTRTWQPFHPQQSTVQTHLGCSRYGSMLPLGWLAAIGYGSVATPAWISAWCENSSKKKGKWQAVIPNFLQCNVPFIAPSRHLSLSWSWYQNTLSYLLLLHLFQLWESGVFEEASMCTAGEGCTC